MDIKSAAIAGAIAFAATIGAASAAELSTLQGISAEPLTATEMAAVRGTALAAVATAFALPNNPITGAPVVSGGGQVGSHRPQNWLGNAAN